jgi:hypothetical protein
MSTVGKAETHTHTHTHTHVHPSSTLGTHKKLGVAVGDGGVGAEHNFAKKLDAGCATRLRKNEARAIAGDLVTPASNFKSDADDSISNQTKTSPNKQRPLAVRKQSRRAGTAAAGGAGVGYAGGAALASCASFVFGPLCDEVLPLGVDGLTAAAAAPVVSGTTATASELMSAMSTIQRRCCAPSSSFFKNLHGLSASCACLCWTTPTSQALVSTKATALTTMTLGALPCRHLCQSRQAVRSQRP